MKTNMIFQQISKKNYSQFFIIFSFVIFFLIGLAVYKDYGLSNDEPFQRTIGYFWLIELIQKFSQDHELINVINQKFKQMYWSDYVLNGNLIQYGILFDTFAAYIEEVLNITENQDAFYLKHILTFITFFISSIFFYRIILERFNNSLFALLVTFFYVTSPRIFAESFYNCKDIVFMSFIVLAIFYALKSFERFDYRSIFFFSLFSAFATNVRIMGLLIFFLYLVFLFFITLENKHFYKKNVFKFFILITSFPLIMLIFWPFLWESPITNLLYTIKSFANYNMSFEILYLGEYYNIKNLPWHYIPVWIFATTPIIFLIFFFIGFTSTAILLSQNFLNLTKKNKLLKNLNQKKDFFIFFFFLIPIFLVIFLNSTLYTGWRHLYFIFPSLTYFIAIGIRFVYTKKNFKPYLKSISAVILLSLTVNTYNIIKLHPYPNIYFNFLFEKKANELFEIDYWGLGNVEALNFINNNRDIGEKVDLKIASFTPLEYSNLILNKSILNDFSFIGTSEKDLKYIFTNFIFNKNPKYERKYFIPKNYDKIFSLKRGNIIINEVYKKR